MKQASETIVFFGSGPVAAESLRLLAEHFPIEAVITKPRATHHRGPVPVLAAAEELGLPVHTAENRKQLDNLFATIQLNSRIGVLIDFGIIISQQIINYFPLGIVNSHFSVLPEWRGADPITFAILSGQKQTGVSVMLLVAGMDEGPLLGYGEQDLTPDITAPELTSRLIKLSDALLAHDLPRYLAGEAHSVPQEITGRQVSYSRKLTKEDGRIDWTKPAAVIEREIRAFIEWPKSRTHLAQTDIIVTRAHVVPKTGTPGTAAVEDKLPVVYCSEQALALDRVKPAGKQEMTGQAFLAGYSTKL
jgi:methionyl-tRNA formyltransferase